MDSSPLISVVIPVYNKASYLESTVKSVVDQAYPNLEILIRNDGSSDDSEKIIESLPKLHPEINFQIFSGENRGASFGRNFLIEKAKSERVVLLDADDLMLPGFLTAASDAMNTQGAKVVYSDVAVEGGHVDEWCPPPFDPFGIRYGNCLTSLVMMDKEVWRAVGGYEEGLPFNEDWSFFIRAAQYSQAFHKLPGKYFTYRQNTEGLYKKYVVENEALNLAVVVVANSDLYPIEEVLNAVGTLQKMPQHWLDKFSEAMQKHPERAIAPLLLGIAAIPSHDPNTIFPLLEHAAKLAEKNEWIMFFLLGELNEKKDKTTAAAFYHIVRTRRPDMGKIVNTRIRELTERA